MTKNVRRNYKLIRRKGKERWGGGKKIKIGVRGNGRGKETLCGGLNGERAEREREDNMKEIERKNEGRKERKGRKEGKQDVEWQTKGEEEK